jgi:Protein of unknown function (DUF2806)
MIADPADGDEATRGFIAFIANFDWFKIPGAVRAIAQVVAGSADAASAWIDIVQAAGQQKAQRIRDDTVARSKISTAVGKAGARKAADTPAIVDRALERLYAEQLRYQENREAVARQTIELLSDSALDAQARGAQSQEPSADWLNVFSGYAEKASSDVLRQHWARILAREIRAPGSFSLATLLMLSIVDSRYAPAMTRARQWIADDWLPVLGKLGVSPYYDDVLVLDSIGFLRVGSSKMFRPISADMPIITPYVSTGIAVYGTPGQGYVINGGLLTIAGKEMLQIMPPEEDPDMIRHVATGMKALGFHRVEIGSLKRENGVVTGIENAAEV